MHELNLNVTLHGALDIDDLRLPIHPTGVAAKRCSLSFAIINFPFAAGASSLRSLLRLLPWHGAHDQSCVTPALSTKEILATMPSKRWKRLTC